MSGYQLKITIKGSKPPIWRRIVIPEGISFADLDNVIEEIFGWTHSHLYEFYIREDETRITIDPEDYNQEDARETCVDEVFYEGAKCCYTYDFGDDWEHNILVEKVVPYGERYATVVKSKGPNMIEDCGGIWGFYECIEEAEEFDIEAVNKVLKKMSFKEMEIPFFDDDEYDDEDDMEDITFENAEELEQYLEEKRESFRIRKEEAENWAKANSKLLSYPIVLADVFSNYTKAELSTIADINGFSGYSKLKKAELVEWLSEKFLDKDFFEKMLSRFTPSEFKMLQDAMDSPHGIWAAEEMMEESPFLCTYGAYNGMEIVRLPDDVKKLCKSICTPEYVKEKLALWEIAHYVNASLYLYGVFTEKMLMEIYEHYEGKELNKEDLKKVLTDYTEAQEVYRVDELFIDKTYWEGGVWKEVLEEQGKIDYYLPDTKEEFLDFGQGGADNLEESEKAVLSFFQTEYQLNYPEAAMLYIQLQMYVHANYDVEDLAMFLNGFLIENRDTGIGDGKAWKKAKRELKTIYDSTRVPMLRGHKRLEIKKPQKNNVISFPGKGGK